MKTIFASFRQNGLRLCGIAAACAMAAGFVAAQAQAPRIFSEINTQEQVPLKGSQHPLAQAQNDAGRMPADTRLTGVSLVFSRSAAQQADLQALIAAQQTPTSPLYHQWLTPDQFAARFGMASSDIEAVQGWLERQGFAVDSVSRSHTSIRFSGTVGQVESAFATQMHYYKVNGERHFAPSTALSVPAAMASTVAAVRNLNDFRPKAQHTTPKTNAARPGFTSGQSGSVFFTPGDIKIAYDINPLIKSGYIGTGQTIAVMGQSAVVVSDIEAFQSAASLTVKDPTLALVPDTGTSATVSGDESESDLDLEWSGAIATGANLLFVYTGNSSNNNGIFDSLAYTVDEDLAQIITISYGACETEFTSTDITSYEAVGEQATTQGQTIIAASGDQGSTSCFSSSTQTVNGLTVAQQEALAVNYPASSAYVTGMGGTEISAANSVSTNSTYWTGETSGTDILTSALTYIPELAWNDDSSKYGLSASGGGTSALITRPSWQAGVTGIASGSYRLVPDLALYSSPDYPGYLYCTSDSNSWSSGQTASCNSGFRDSSTEDLTIAGGTSFAAPIFAGMLAIINQDKGYVTGQGPINSTLYPLAASSTTYSSAFHDITSGNNYCTAGTTYCASNGSTLGFAAGTGYDEVTGLGSVDLNNLATAWPAISGTSASLIGTTTTVSASTSAPTAGASVIFTITIAPDSGTGTPSGTVNLAIDGGGTSYSNSGTTTSVTLGSSGTATYTTSFSTAGTHSVVAKYAGSTTYAASAGTASVTIAGTSSGTGTFALTATNLTESRGTSGSSTITVTPTPASGYTGTVLLTFDTSNDTALTNLCYSFTNTNSSGEGSVAVTGTAAVTTTLTLDSKASDCASTGAISKTGKRPLHVLRSANSAPKTGTNPAPAALAFAGLLLAGFMGRSSRKLRNLAGVIALVAAGLAISACGSSSSSSSVSNPAKGSYTITVTGQDSTTATITATAKFTFVID